jgi:hypothetical protein
MKRVVVLKIDDYNQSALKEKIQEVFLSISTSTENSVRRIKYF